MDTAPDTAGPFIHITWRERNQDDSVTTYAGTAPDHFAAAARIAELLDDPDVYAIRVLVYPDAGGEPRAPDTGPLADALAASDAETENHYEAMLELAETLRSWLRYSSPPANPHMYLP